MTSLSIYFLWQDNSDRATERRLNESLEETAARRQGDRDRAAERRLNES